MEAGNGKSSTFGLKRARELAVPHRTPAAGSLRAATVVLITVVPADKYGLDRAIFSNAEMSGLDVVASALTPSTWAPPVGGSSRSGGN